jgi:hypothetical protein
MSIIISKNGKNAQKVDQANVDKEDYLQNYIHQNPESIPVYEIEEDKRLFVAAREFSTESGPIDALAVDKDGDIYIVETKLYKNPDKRTVVAQALDYGAALWKHTGDFGEFLTMLDEKVRNSFKISFSEKVKEFFGLDDEQTGLLLDAMARNLKDGNLKFVILMDSLDDRLKDLIIYINQNSQFDIFAVQMEFYKYNEYEIMIPKLFGSEVKKGVPSSSSARKKWDEASFFEALKQQLDIKYQPVVKKLYDFTKAQDGGVKWGSGSTKGSCNAVFNKVSPTKSVYTIWTDGKLTINFGWLIDDEKAVKFRDALKQELETKLGLAIPENYREHFIPYSIEQWQDKAEKFMAIIKNLT